MNKVTKRFKSLMLVSFGVALLDIFIGIMFMAFTEFSTKVNMTILGSTVVVHALFFLIRYIYDGLGKKVFAIDLIAGVASLILGLFTIFNPFGALDIIGVLFCIWLLIVGAEKLYFGIKFMKKQEDIFPLVTFIAILSFVMGLLVLFNPFEMFMLITRLIGLFMICSGLFEIMTCMLFRKRAKYILDMFK